VKIEFRKVPLISSEFEISSNSVKFLGNFSKISSKLVKVDAKLIGKCDVDCCKCGSCIVQIIDEKVDFLISDGIYTQNEQHDDEEFIIIEIDDHIIDFDEILHSEIESLKSEYYICDTCKNNNNLVEIEY
jgi:hypothetical protein